MLDGFNHAIINDSNRGLREFRFHPYIYAEDFNKVMFGEDSSYIWTQLLFDESVRRQKYKNKLTSQGLLVDEEYNVFVNPELGAFYGNTHLSTLEEVIEEDSSMDFRLEHYGMPDVVSIIDFLADGYEFTLGPALDVYEHKMPENLHGIYCTNYNRIVKKLDRKK